MNRVLSAVIVLIGLAAPAWAGFDEGVAAYNRGDYATALREWRPLAKQGALLRFAHDHAGPHEASHKYDPAP